MTKNTQRRKDRASPIYLDAEQAPELHCQEEFLFFIRKKLVKIRDFVQLSFRRLATSRNRQGSFNKALKLAVVNRLCGSSFWIFSVMIAARILV